MEKRNWKADEMEMSINFYAARASFVFSGISLLGYCIGYYVQNNNLPFIPFLLLCGQSIVFYSVKLAMTKRLANNQGDDRKDENEE